VTYSYAPGRGAEHAIKLLAGYCGIVQCDGYAAYKHCSTANRNSCPAALAFCWAICEDDSTSSLKRVWRRSRRKRSHALLRSMQSRSGSVGAAPRNAWRSVKLESKPLIRCYSLKHWDGLVRFVADGRIEMDTNAVERAIRPVAMTESLDRRARRGKARRHRPMAFICCLSYRKRSLPPGSTMLVATRGKRMM
jgi:transposase